MIETPFSRAERVARETLNVGGSVTLQEWAHAVHECTDVMVFHQLEDHAIDTAAALGPVVVIPSAGRSDSALVQAFAAARHVPLKDSQRAAAQRQARTAVLFATHAAGRQAGDLGQVLLGAVERDLLGPASLRAEPFERALSQWSAALSHETTHPISAHLALAVARNQATILRLGEGLLKQVDENPAAPGSHDRLRYTIGASSHAWDETATRWRADLRRSVADDGRGDVARLSLASEDLRAALRMQISPAGQLNALLATGFGGNVVATILTAEDIPHRARPLVLAAQRLDQAAASLTGQTTGPPFIDRAASAAPAMTPITTDRVEQRLAAQPPPASQSARELVVDPVRRGVEADAVKLTREVENELANRRDVGVLAQAALDGDPDAQAMVAHVDERDLTRLSIGGRTAQATLVASAMPTLRYANKNFYNQNDFREAVQRGALDIAAAASKWDPNKARWSTYIQRLADWAEAHTVRNSYKLPIPKEFEHDTTQGWVHENTSNAEDEALKRLQLRDLRDQVGKLSPDLRKIVSDSLGLDGQPPKTQQIIGEEMGTSASTVARGYRQAVSFLQRAMTETQERPERSVEELQATMRALQAPGGVRGAEAPLERVQRLLQQLQDQGRPVRGAPAAPVAQPQNERGITRDL